MEETPIAAYRTAPLASPVGLRIYEQEVEVRRPALTRHTTQRIRYDQIAQVVVRRGMLLSMLVIESTGGHTIVVEGMAKATAEEARSAIQERMNLAALATADTSSSPASDVPAQIRALAELKEAGIITEAEFETKKKDLLDRM